MPQVLQGLSAVPGGNVVLSLAFISSFFSLGTGHLSAKDSKIPSVDLHNMCLSPYQCPEPQILSALTFLCCSSTQQDHWALPGPHSCTAGWTLPVGTKLEYSEGSCHLLPFCQGSQCCAGCNVWTWLFCLFDRVSSYPRWESKSSPWYSIINGSRGLWFVFKFFFHSGNLPNNFKSSDIYK